MILGLFIGIMFGFILHSLLNGNNKINISYIKPTYPKPKSYYERSDDNV